ncbi:exosome complex exonuclease RRP44 [Patella vulgata]|uniref:exosome complex exonuclease RRP44 n=1 Tax=Patella vulgata TaxID=6465 RepID=UPI0021804535|nr:exosome complex exonuclease RRP44 [Patella vulgata]
MLTSKVFVKKTKRGGVLKVVREHYLRDDITCGSQHCTKCDHNVQTENSADTDSDSYNADNFKTQPLVISPPSNSVLCSSSHYVIPDTNVVLHQIDVLEDESLQNFIILQTVIDEVKHRSLPANKRLKDILTNSSKHFYTFCNEYNSETYVEREPGESSNDRNDRAIRTAAKWYTNHLQEYEKDISIVLLTDDNDNRTKAKEAGILSFTVHEYIKSLKNGGNLIDRLAWKSSAGTQQEGKLIYPEHIATSDILKGVKSGKYLQGSFMASRENYLEASVNVTESEKFVLIQGHQNLNRAVHSDIVAIEMLPEAEWSCPSSLVLEDTAQAEDDALEDDSKLKNKVPEHLRQPTGRVVGIIKRNWRQYCGILKPSLLKKGTKHLFVPAERRIPKIRIETRQAEDLATQRVIVAIDSWPRSSRYPQGHFVRKLGNIGDKGAENEVLLLEHDVPHQVFSEKVLSFLPKMPWSITEEDMKHRKDLRDIVVCSVDPPGCTDIDDALHCRLLDNGNYEVGVHIADVSHFIRPGTALDEEAANRGTTVYLTDKRIDMVPELLSSNLCSLRCDVERLAFTVIWEMTENAKILNTTFTKSVINSKASLMYSEAQARIDDITMNDELTLSLRGLNKLAKLLKQSRIDAGALCLASTEVRFQVDSETADPIDVQTKKLLETNSMVEEFMLLANISVAKKILEEFPNCALLRRHPSPPPSNFEPVIKAASSKGFIMDCSSNKNLAESLNKAEFDENPYFNTMLRIMTTRCMMQAVYFCSGMLPESEYVHYGLAAAIYTHFTSPIRRYSDIIVHRLLAVCIGADASYPDLLEKKKTQSLCNNLNYRHKMAQYAGRASVNLHTHLFFKTRVQDEDGYVLFVRKNALQVLIPKYGLEGTLYLNENKKSPTQFFYNEEQDTQTAGDVVFHVFDHVIIQLSIDRSNVQHLKLAINLVKPQIPGFSVPPASQVHSEKEEVGPPSKKVRK